MSKMFSFQKVSGPIVSVRHHGTSSSVSRSTALPASRRVTKGSWLSSLRKIASSASGMGTFAVYGLFMLFGAGVISYIFLINSSAAKGYEMKKIQNRIQEQSDIRHSLEIKAAEFASLGAIDQAAESANLVSIKNEEFLIPTSVTALKTTK